MNPVTIEVELSGAYEKTYTDVHVLTSVDDLLEYQSVQDERVRRDFRKYLQSARPDHEKYGAEVSSLFVVAIISLSVVVVVATCILSAATLLLLVVGFHSEKLRSISSTCSNSCCGMRTEFC